MTPIIPSDKSFQRGKLMFHYEGLPIGKPRMVNSDRWRDPPRGPVLRWRAFKSQFLAVAMEQGFRPGWMSITSLSILAIFPMPKSWPMAKRSIMLGGSHRQKPDLSNIVKGVEDALVDDDETIALYTACAKLWGPNPGLTVSLEWEEKP